MYTSVDAHTHTGTNALVQTHWAHTLGQTHWDKHTGANTLGTHQASYAEHADNAICNLICAVCLTTPPASHHTTSISPHYQHLTTPPTQVNVIDRRVVVSEKAAAGAVLAQRVEVGDVLEGYVTYVSDFGAFVVLNDPAGKVAGAEVCV